MGYLIIGNGISGIQASLYIRKYDTDTNITIITDEDYPFYSRPLIVDVMVGKREADETIIMDENFYKANNFSLLKGTRVKKIDPKDRYVETTQGKIGFKSLLIATGAKPKKIDKNKDGVFYLRQLKDAEKIRNYLKKVKKAIVYGGGPVGIKAAYSLISVGLPVSIVVSSPRIFSRVFDKKASDFLQGIFEKHGAKFYLETEIDDLIWQKGMKGVVTNRGDKISGEILIVGKGVRADTEIAYNAGIDVNEGILVDDKMETNIEGIYAAGDAAEAKTKVTVTSKDADGKGVVSLWHIGAEQGKIAGINMAGLNRLYDGSVGSNSVEYFGIKAISMGITEGKGYSESVYEDSNQYRKLLFNGDRIIGAVLVGNIQGAGIILDAIKKGTPPDVWDKDFISANCRWLADEYNISMEVLF